MSWNPWSFFLMLDYFSRVYFVGVLLVVIWSYTLIFRIVVGLRVLQARSDNFNESEYSKLERINRNLHSIFSLGVTCTSGCCVNQIFGVWFVYMARVTDANPFCKTQPPWEFLLSASRNSLQSYELSRLSHAANLRKEIGALLDLWM